MTVKYCETSVRFCIMWYDRSLGNLHHHERWQRVRGRNLRTDAAVRSRERLLPVVRSDLHGAYDRGIDSQVLLHGPPAAILDCSASLDDEGDRCGRSMRAYTLRRLLEGVSHERARCWRGISIA